jgi:hypothetical protein
MKTLLVRMRANEYEELKEKADKVNLPLSRYIILKALNKLNEN